MQFKKIQYSNLNARQQENYNYQKIAAVLAEYGYSCLWLNDDWQSADFIANHIDGNEFLKVQLKSRVTINKKYIGKDIYIAFRHESDVYLYPHDNMMNFIIQESPNTIKRLSWTAGGGFSWPKVTKKLATELEKYKL